MKDIEKVEALRRLLGTVVQNTKLAMTGKTVTSNTEQRLTARMLEVSLGRKPSEEEIALAQTY